MTATPWETAARYARRHPRLPPGADPAEFAEIWANMTRGFHLGELRELPSMAEAFDDWLREVTGPLGGRSGQTARLRRA